MGRYDAQMTNFSASSQPGDRSNVQLGATVDIGVELLAARGRRAAATFLDAAGVSFATTVRVLAEPYRRRIPIALNVLPMPRLKR